MPAQSTPVPGGAGADIYLQVQTARAGRIKGESSSPGHLEEIELTGWQWGLSASSALGSTQATGRRAYTALTVHKRVDAATTPLLSALATNDAVKEVTLTLRRAGGEQDDFFFIKLKDARLTSLHHTGTADGEVQETATFAFLKVEVEYRPQKATGGRGGSFVFTDELAVV